jgi:hypothetical protein
MTNILPKKAFCLLNVPSSEVIVIGEDTDLLVLLIHHVNQQCKRVIFKSDKMAINKTRLKYGTFNKQKKCVTSLIDGSSG